MRPYAPLFRLAGTILLTTAMIWALSGCAKVVKFTLADVTRAKEIAVAAQDKAGEACASALLGSISAASPPLAPTGPFSGFMLAREARRTVDAGVDESVKIACAPLVLDAERTILKLGTSIAPGGGIAGTLLGR